MKFNNSFSSVTVVPFFLLLIHLKIKKKVIRPYVADSESFQVLFSQWARVSLLRSFFSLTIIFEKNSDFIFSRSFLISRFSIWNKDNQLIKFPNFSVSKREFERELISGGRKSFLGFFSEREKWDLTDDGRRGHFI